MKPAAFKYLAPESCEEALSLKARYGDDARFLAGGQSLVPAMNFRLAQPAIIIDINRIASLAAIEDDVGALRVGALARYRALQRSPAVARRQSLIHEALPHVAHPQIRNRGTLGGNLAQADPASELPAVIVALNARLRVRSQKGERWIAARDFFVGTLTTALAGDEMLVEIELPAMAPRTGTAFLEVARRRGDYALVGVAAMVTLAPDGACAAARLAYCGVGATPMAAPQAARTLAGRRIGDAEIRDACAQVPREIEPFGTVHASREFQIHLARVLTERALRTALSRAADATHV